MVFVQRDTDQDLDIINVIPVTGGNPEKVCVLDLNKYMIMNLTWTSNGRFIIFSSLSLSEESENQCELMRVSAEGGNPEKLGISMYGISYMSIHPNGRQIAFSSQGSTKKPAEIWVMENFLPVAETKK
ncbi:MAG: PD40 domain-containing protein [Bacteroidetes bacterium]|nr:PD40 domain-containing protein [Bacteroidota bacterium]